MLAIIIVSLFAVYALWRPYADEGARQDITAAMSDRLDKLWQITQESLKDRKYLRAEKALLTILRVDQRNATAYNRLGILYARQQAFNDAIECFEIAQSLEPSASSLHNVGLIYYETKQYNKAALAFEQALAMEDGLSTRYIAYAKVQEKLNNTRKMVNALEKAVEIDPIPQTLNVLADAYDRLGETELALTVREKAARLLIPTKRPKRVRQPRRVVM